jgi:hypothetical protein
VLYTEVSSFQATAPTAANLLASALQPATPDNRWMEGFAFRGELCPALQVFGPCSEPTTPDTDTSEVVVVRPAGYRVLDTCSTLEVGFDAARVIRLADAVASYAVARELWGGAGTQAEPYDVAAYNGQTHNPYLADGNVTVLPNSGTTAVTTEQDALGVLEQPAREHTRGQQVFLHVPIRLVTRIGAQLRRVGNEIRTHTDAVVIADAGYPGTGPGVSPTGLWAYATGPVEARLGPVVATADRAVTINRATNERQVWADRMFAAAFDPCCQFGIQVPVA